MQSWDSWGADDQGGFNMTPASSTTQPAHVQQSNIVQRNNAQPEQQEEEEPNFFEDMAPKIKKAPKVIFYESVVGAE